VGALPVWERTATSADAAAELAKEVAALVASPARDGARVAVIVESIADFLSTPADPELIQLFKAAKRNDHFVIAEGETSTWSSSWPLLMEIRSGRRGFALQPDQQEGDLLFRTTFPRSRRSEFPPGRGLLVEAGKVRKVQIARDLGDG
jgi:S-DNA-T family DNA segregation ATPase FtsK/SpoIIIE